MSRDPLHVVFGAGQVGRTLAARLAELGVGVRTVSSTTACGSSPTVSTGRP